MFHHVIVFKSMARQKLFLKTLFCFTFFSLAVLIVILITDPRNRLSDEYYKVIIEPTNYKQHASPTDMKFILQWTPATNSPFVYMGKGQNIFLQNKCLHNNCYVTHDRNLLGRDYTNFDVIAFNGPDVRNMVKSNLPQRRSPHQKYVFGTIESADYYPICQEMFDGFFNWTWTYKLDSDIKWGYISVRDSNGKIIGPKENMHWIKEMDPIDDKLKEQLNSKKKAAAWFVSNCRSRNYRENIVKKIQSELKRYGLEVDVYGACGPLKCSRNTEERCWKMLEDDYYFYFSFENSFSDDYVTEKLIHGLQHNAVPVVFGGANYTRFMPDGIYLNARELGAEKLAQTMYEIIQDPERYHQFFRWKKYYSYHNRNDSPDTNDYCSLCAILNNEQLLRTKSVYEDFRGWWNNKSPKRC